MADPALIQNLLHIIFKNDGRTSFLASWVLDIVCVKNIGLLLPYLETFIKNIEYIILESSIRSIAKICEMLATHHYYMLNNEQLKILDSHHIDKIIEVCFYYLIEAHKVAPKAYAMQTLALLSKERSWIKENLRNILERNYPTESKVYQARVRHIFKKL